MLLFQAAFKARLGAPTTTVQKLVFRGIYAINRIIRTPQRRIVLNAA